jgi:hypothetical protein
MKKAIFFITLILIPLTFSYCKKEYTENAFTNLGKITGYDPRKCPSPCCGGWYIEINNKTYRFFALPENSNLYLGFDSLPIYVLVSWKKYENGCAGDEIVIDYIKKII